jgi:hypothetical protein
MSNEIVEPVLLRLDGTHRERSDKAVHGVEFVPKCRNRSGSRADAVPAYYVGKQY